MLKDRLKQGVLKFYNSPYRNKWFLVAKKEKGTYRLIIAVVEINQVTIRDANVPLNIDKFSNEFAGLTCSSLIDFFFKYDQFILNIKSRDIIILVDCIPNIALPYIDNIRVKGLRSFYNYKENTFRTWTRCLYDSKGQEQQLLNQMGCYPLINFEVKYILRMKNTAADGLLRRTRPYPSNLIKEDEIDIDK
ncbi:unnamed protein product [Diplocarpon coronariae]